MNYGETEAARAQVLTKSAIRHLVHYSEAPAVALIHRVTNDAGPATFPGRDVYDRMAEEAGLFVLAVVHPVPKGFEHVLFLAKEPGLTEDVLRSCRQPRRRNRHEAGDGA